MSLEHLEALNDNNKIEHSKNSLQQKEKQDLINSFKSESTELANKLANKEFSLVDKEWKSGSFKLQDILKAIDTQHYLNSDSWRFLQNIDFTIQGKSYNIGRNSELWATIQSFLITTWYGNKLGSYGIDGKIGTATLQGIEKYIANLNLHEMKKTEEINEKEANLPNNLVLSNYYQDFEKWIKGIQVFPADFTTMFTSYRAKKLWIINQDGTLKCSLNKKNNTIDFSPLRVYDNTKFNKTYSIDLKSILEMNWNNPEVSRTKFPKEIQKILEEKVFADYNKEVVDYYTKKSQKIITEPTFPVNTKIDLLKAYKNNIITTNDVDNTFDWLKQFNTYIDWELKKLENQKSVIDKNSETQNKANVLYNFMRNYKVNLNNLGGISQPEVKDALKQRNIWKFLDGFKNDIIKFEDISVTDDSSSWKRVEFRLNNDHFENKDKDYLSINLIKADNTVDEKKVNSRIKAILEREIKKLAQ